MSGDASWPRWVGTDHTRKLLNLREVAPSLYVGNARAATTYGPEHWSIEGPEQVESIARWGLIVSYVPASEEPVRKPAGVPHLYLPFTDGRKFPPFAMWETVAAVEAVRLRQPSAPVLLHCAMGLSRSASAAYGLLRVLYRLSPVEAKRRIQTDIVGYPMPGTFNAAHELAEEIVRRRARRQGGSS